MNSSANDTPNALRPALLVWRAVAAALLASGGMTLACAADAPSTAVQAGPLSLTFGGFIAFESLYRNRNEATDIGSNFNTGIPFAYQANDHISEFRETARQSRLSLLAQGPHTGSTSAEAYFEFDFLGAAPTANSSESNSYNLRIRNVYGLFRNTDSGFYMLAGQNWSLATLYSKGLNPRSERAPQTIDAQYATGFNWTRNPQLRLVKSWGDTVAFGISFESPQASIYNGPNAPTATPILNSAGTGQFAPTVNYTLDFVPDVIAKFAFDPGYGHYEVYALARGFRDRVNGDNDTVWGSGIGAGLVLPLSPQIDFQLSGLAGSGIGRYGTSQLPDVTVKPDGTLGTISGVDVLAGLVFRPAAPWTFYVYGGMEQASKTDFTLTTGTTSTGYGYGSALYNNSGCNTLVGNGATATAATCVGNTKTVSQISAGTWWKYYQGPMGNLQFGLQASYTKRATFTGVGGDPSTDMSLAMVSFRYYPYQR